MLNKSKAFLLLLISFILVFYTNTISGPFGYYPTYHEIDTILDGLQQRYPNLMKRGVLSPKSIENNDIFYAKISNSPNSDNKKPEALITGGQHSCEVIGPACVRLDMYHLLDNYDTDPEVKWLVDNRQIYFVPVMNPDGYLYVESSGNKNWRKTRRRNSGGSYGVDPNRNYPYKWGYDDINSSPNPSAMNYRGEAPASEPETKAMINFINSRKFRTWQNHHSANDVLVIPFGYDYRVSLGTDSIKYYTMCEEQQAEYGRFTDWGPSYISYNGWSLNGGTEDWGWSDSATYRLYCIITELGKSMWESNAAAKVTAEKMLGADMYMIKCAGFYPVLKKITLKDNVSGNNDGKLNPGETVKLLAEFENKSVVDTTPAVKGTLTSSYTHIQMKDANADYGDIEWLSDFENSSSDPFEFKCASQAQEGDWAKFNLKLTWTMNTVNFEKNFACSLQVGRLVWITTDQKILNSQAGLCVLQNPNRDHIRFKLVIPSSENRLSTNIGRSHIAVYDALGKEIRRFNNIEFKNSQFIDWDLTNNYGERVTNNIYFIRAKVNGLEISQKFLIR